MKLHLFSFGFALVFSAHAGNISGTVNAKGKDGVSEEVSEGKYSSRKYKFAERIDYSELRDFVVYIEGRLGSNTIATGNTQVVTTSRVDQKGAVFSPHVLPVVVGTKVEWPNQDDILHNVFSMSEVKEFDLGLYKHPEVKSVQFDKAGRIDAFCSIHKAMHCIILVLENPYFAPADAHGHYQIANVPPGTYKLKAWHERLPAMTKEIVVPEKGDLRVDFTLGIVNLPKY